MYVQAARLSIVKQITNLFNDWVLMDWNDVAEISEKTKLIVETAQFDQT